MKTSINNSLYRSVIGVIVLTFFACNYTYISEELVTKLINSPTTIIVDVRPHSDFEKGHIPHSINIPLENLSKSTNILKPYTDIIFVCRTGTRSTQAMKIVENIEDKQFYNGGDWHRINTILKISR